MYENPTIIFTGPGQVIIDNMYIPVPGEGQLLVKTSRTLISTGTELTILERKDVPVGSGWDQYGKFPFEPGYDNIGVVIETGSGVDAGWIGKKVASYAGHSKFAVINEKDVRLIQRDIKDEAATFFTIAEIVMNSIRRGRVGWGESVVVYGLGLLGQLAVRFCRMCGARPVIAVDTSDYRIGRLQDELSIISINPGKEDVNSIVREATKGRMADIVFEVTGIAELIPEEFKVLRNQGRFVVLSSPRGRTLFDFHDLCNSPSFEIIGAHNFSHPSHETLHNPWTMKRDAEFFFDLVADGEIGIEALISHREHYSEAVNLYNLLMKDRSAAMGVILEWS